MLFSVGQAFVGREELRASLKTHAWEAKLYPVHRRKMSDWSSRDHVTLPNSKWRQYLHTLFIPVERRLIAA